MKEKDLERIFAALRPKDVYKSFDDEALRAMIRKSHENTFIFEPNKWLVAADYKPLESGKER